MMHSVLRLHLLDQEQFFVVLGVRLRLLLRRVGHRGLRGTCARWPLQLALLREGDGLSKLDLVGFSGARNAALVLGREVLGACLVYQVVALGNFLADSLGLQALGSAESAAWLARTYEVRVFIVNHS